jgi:hypothetical protein
VNFGRDEVMGRHRWREVGLRSGASIFFALVRFKRSVQWWWKSSDLCCNPLSVKAGAQVVYSKYAGTKVEFNGEVHLPLKEDDVVGLLLTKDVKDLEPANDRVLIQVRREEVLGPLDELWRGVEPGVDGAEEVVVFVSTPHSVHEHNVLEVEVAEGVYRALPAHDEGELLSDGGSN